MMVVSPNETIGEDLHSMKKKKKKKKMDGSDEDSCLVSCIDQVGHCP